MKLQVRSASSRPPTTSPAGDAQDRKAAFEIRCAVALLTLLIGGRLYSQRGLVGAPAHLEHLRTHVREHPA